jgi:hypothetical protein
MRPRLVTGFTLLCALLLASCAPAGGPSYPVGGRAVAGPVCPVERIPPDPACAPRPVVGAVLVIAASDGHEVARATTDTDGRWTVTLAAGTYTLTPQAVSGLLGRAPALQFTVSTTGSSIGLDVTYDTGIR